MGNVGGQALIEGVLMKGDKYIARAVYSPQNNLIIDKKEFHSISDQYPVLKLPFLRGFINLIEMMIMGVDSLTYSMQISQKDTEQLTKKEMTNSVIFSFLISIILFIVIPAAFFTFLKQSFVDMNIILLNLLEGIIRITIFLSFLTSTLFMNDMKRVYEYHGAEHKAVNAYEAGIDLTVEKVKNYSCVHVRCGTSFVMVVFFISVFIFSFIGKQDLLPRVFFKLLLLPVISGISYELIKYSAKHSKNIFLKIFLSPGMLMQKITTREPDDKQIFAAISALKEVV